MLRKLTLLLTIFSLSFSIAEGQMARVYKPVTPVSLEDSHNPVIRLEVIMDDTTGSALTQISLAMADSTKKLIQNVSVFYTGSSKAFAMDTLFGKANNTESLSVVKGQQPLTHEVNYFWVSISLKEKAELLDRINLHIDHIAVDGKKIAPAAPRKEVVLRPAIKLRERGQGGVDTYRIPGFATTNKGTLIAVYDVRYNSARDLQANIDVGMSRSTDKGKTWEPMQIIMDKGTWGGLPENQNGVGDAAVLVDRATNTIWVAALWAHGHEGERLLSYTAPGYGPKETGQLLLVKSEDDGKTWSEPINLTKELKKKEWHILFNGPGSGITMENGTLVFAGQYWDKNGMPHSTIIYSKDHGKTWHVGTGAKPNTTEAQVVQLSNGTLMLNMRDNRGGSRSVYITDDMGKTWTKHPTSRQALREPVSMASINQFPPGEDKNRKEWLFFSNPNSTEARKNMTIKLSTDDGMTWPNEYWILLNEKVGYGYSSLTVIDENTIGILYEGVGELFFQKINIFEFTQNNPIIKTK